jgi:signal transduction histidine kinase
MVNKKPFLANRWMLTPIEIVAIVAVVALTIGGIFASIQDALQLGRALNLNLTQTIILNQGIVNLQRDVQLTHNEVTRLLGRLDFPPKPITRFAFVKIQVNNLVTAVESSTRTYTFANDDLALVHEIADQSAMIEQLIAAWELSESTSQQNDTLKAMDAQLGTMEATIKQLVDRQATIQREEIIQTRDSLAVSQRTSLLAGVVLLLMSVALAVVFRRTLTQRLQQAVEADRLKSQLLANVSHELRTPINAIQGYSQLLDEEIYGSVTDKQQIAIRRIIINTTQLEGMVNNLLDRAQIEQGRLTLRNEPFVPSELIETTNSALSILAVTQNLELTSEITSDVPAALNGDVLRLQQILFNLVSNAIKFTESGSVHMRIFLPDPAHWAMQVIDTGIGILPEDQSRVFTSFWQIDSSATRQYRGSGLGLSIVKQLTDLMGGKLTLTSQPGKGSTFTISFPLEVK